MATVTVNSIEKELPESRKLSDVVYACSDIREGDMFFAKVNGKLISSITDASETTVEPGDVIEVYPLVIGG